MTGLADVGVVEGIGARDDPNIPELVPHERARRDPVSLKRRGAGAAPPSYTPARGSTRPERTG